MKLKLDSSKILSIAVMAVGVIGTILTAKDNDNKLKQMKEEVKKELKEEISK